MSKKAPAASQHVNGAQVQDPIKVPEVTEAISGTASDEQLAALQDQAFGEKPAKEAPPPAAPAPAPHKQRAKEIFDRAQAAAKKEKPPEKKEKEKDDDLPIIDTLQFLTDNELNPTDDENPRTGEEDDDDDTPPVETPPVDDGELDRENNIKNLRTKAKTAVSENQTLKTRVSELEAKLAEQPSVTALTTQLNDAKQRVQQLEQYEVLFALQDNPEFKSKFIDGDKSLTGEMKTIAKDYGVEESIVDEFLTLTNRREIDEFLTENFDSEQARQDLKALKQKRDGLQRERKEFEKKPGESYAQFEARKAQKETELLTQRDAHYTRIKNEGWGLAIAKNAELPNDQKIMELVEVPGKKDHNEKVVRPTLNGAKSMYESGLAHIEKAIRTKSVLGPKFTEWFSNLCLQATASQMINTSRLGLHRKYQEAVSEQNKQRSMERPGLSTGARSSSNEGTKKPKDGKDIAANIFQSVMEETQQ